MDDRFAITAGSIVTMNSPPISDGAVVVHNGKIEKVVVRENIPHEIRVEEHPDGIIMPAFVNAHTHLVFTMFKGLADDAGFFEWLTGYVIPLGLDKRDDECRDSARAGTHECFRNGITCVGESHYTRWGHRAMLEAGMKGVFFREVFGIRSLNFARSIRDHKSEIEKLAGESTDRNRIGISPHAPYSVPPPMARMASEVAEKHNLPISIHVGETRDEIEFFRHGTGNFSPVRILSRFPNPSENRTPLTYLDDFGLLTNRTLLIHGIYLSDNDLKLIASHGCTMVTCPTSNAKLGVGIARASAWKSHGIQFCIATDSPASGESYDLFEEMRRFALFQRGLTGETESFMAKEILESVTVIPARALGMDGMVGDLKEGSCADFILIKPERAGTSGNRDIYRTIVWGTRRDDIAAVWSDGREVFR
ncbi:MAG TPA: hypothetical protein ENN67_05010, partial [Firmicutes bacterium]|nr:hypothetical protein [Bacillota bacterium]